MAAPRSKQKPMIPDNIDEEYYPISKEILTSFPKFRPPVDFFRFHENIAQLSPYSRKGTRLSNEQIEEVATLCADELLFVSRSDLPIYGAHITKQIDLVLLDMNFKPAELVRLVRAALHLRIEAFIEQPVLPVFELLQKDLLVFTELLWKDRHLIKLFMRNLYIGTYSLPEHMTNTLIVGIWYYTYVTAGSDFKRKQLDSLAVAFALMNIGMSKVAPFILTKKQMLSLDDREKIDQHPMTTVRLLQKLGLADSEIHQAAFEHHERIDGSGYPSKSRTISTIGKVAAVADAFSAMLTERPYAKAQAAPDILQSLQRDKRFDGHLVTQLSNAYLTKALVTPDVGKNTASATAGMGQE